MEGFDRRSVLLNHLQAACISLADQIVSRRRRAPATSCKSSSGWYCTPQNTPRPCRISTLTTGTNSPSGCDDGELQAGARSKRGYACLKHGPHEIHLPPGLRGILIKMQRRSGQEHCIVAPQFCIVGQSGVTVGRLDPMADGSRSKRAQSVDVGFSGTASHTLATVVPGLRWFTLGNKETQRG